MTNTEKPTTKAESKKLMVETPKKQKIEMPAIETKIQEDKIKTPDKSSVPVETKHSETKPKDEKKETKKQPPKKAVKKEEVVVNGRSLPISTKYSMAICKFIKGKKISQAIEDLEQVIAKKKAVPMKGEIPHRKGPGKIGSGSGRFPKKASENFINLLRSLLANANNHDVENPVIVEAVANIAQRPYASGGRRKKRTHVTLKAREKKMVKKSKKKTKKKINKK